MGQVDTNRNRETTVSSTATTPTTATTDRSTNGFLIAAAVPMTLVGFLNVVGAFIFAFPGGDLEGIVMGSALVLVGVALAISGVLVARGSTAAVPFAVALLAVDGAFNVYKVFIEGESESTMFLVGVTLAGALLALGLRRRSR